MPLTPIQIPSSSPPPLNQPTSPENDSNVPNNATDESIAEMRIRDPTIPRIETIASSPLHRHGVLLSQIPGSRPMEELPLGPPPPLPSSSTEINDETYNEQSADSSLISKYKFLLKQNKFYSEALDLWISLNEEKQRHLISVLKKLEVTSKKYQVFRDRVKLRERSFRHLLRDFFEVIASGGVSGTDSSEEDESTRIPAHVSAAVARSVPTSGTLLGNYSLASKMEELYDAIEILWDNPNVDTSNSFVNTSMSLSSSMETPATPTPSTPSKKIEKMREAETTLIENGMGILVRAIRETHEHIRLETQKKNPSEASAKKKKKTSGDANIMEISDPIERTVRTTAQQQFSKMVEKQKLTQVFRGEFHTDMLLDDAELNNMLYSAERTEQQMEDKVIERIKKRRELALKMRKKRKKKRRKRSKNGGAKQSALLGKDSTTADHNLSDETASEFSDVASSISPNSPLSSRKRKQMAFASGKTRQSSKHLSPKSPMSSARSPQASPRRNFSYDSLLSLEPDTDIDESLDPDKLKENMALHLWSYNHDVEAKKDEAEERLRSMEEQIRRQKNLVRSEQDKVQNMEQKNDSDHARLISAIAGNELTPIETEKKMERMRQMTVQLLQNKEEKQKIDQKLNYNLSQQEEKLRDFQGEYDRLKQQITIMEERAKVYESEKISDSEAELSYKKLEASKDGCYVVGFTDIMSSTSLWEHNTQDMSKALMMHNEVIREILEETGSVELKTEGDAFVICFVGSDCHKAIEMAINIQLRLLQVDWPASIYDHPSGRREYDQDGNLIYSGLRVRVALHYGPCILKRDPITNRPDLFGSTLNEGARIEQKCEGGEIIISRALCDQLERTPIDEIPHEYSTKCLGSFQMKGLKNDMELHRVIPQGLNTRFFSGQRLQSGILSQQLEYEKLKNELLELMSATTEQFTNIEATLQEREEHIEELEQQLEILRTLRDHGQDSDDEAHPIHGFSNPELPALAISQSPRSAISSGRRMSGSSSTLTRQASLTGIFNMQKKLFSKYKRYRDKTDGNNSVRKSSGLVHSTQTAEGDEWEKLQSVPHTHHLSFAFKQLSTNIRKLRRENRNLTEEKESLTQILKKVRTELSQLQQAFASYKYQQEEVSRRTMDEKVPQTPIERKGDKKLSPLASLSPQMKKKERFLNDRVNNALKMSFDLMMKPKSKSLSPVSKRSPASSALRRPSLFNDMEYFADLSNENQKKGKNSLMVMANRASVHHTTPTTGIGRNGAR